MTLENIDLEDIKLYHKAFWSMVGMASTAAPDGTQLEEVITYIDEMFEEEIKSKEKEKQTE